MRTDTITGTYGSENQDSPIFTATTVFGDTWYVCQGSKSVTLTQEEVYDGVHIENLESVDMFVWVRPINSEAELIKAVEA